MGLVLGFSLNNLTNQVGTYAGLAAVLGVAVLALLFFAQARELKRLREWVEDAAEHSAELEERLRAQARSASPAAQATAAPEPAAAPPAEAEAPDRAPALALPAPAGVGAPALASATRFPGLGAPARPAPSAVPAAATAAAAARVASRPALNTNGARAGSSRPAGPAVTPAPASRPSIPIRTDAASARRAGAPAPTAPPERSPRRRGRLVALAALALVLVAAGVFAATQLGKGGQSGSAARRGAAAPKGAATSAPASGRGFARGSVVVTVLNGTPVPHLANQVASRLRTDGFRRGTVTNASDQQRSATTISYVAGHRRDALAVSRALGISDVQPIDPATKSIACPQPACSTTVVVTVGSDRIR